MILSLGNVGMLISSSPLAWVIEHYGWRAGFWLSSLFGLAVALAVFLLVPKSDPAQADHSSPWSQMVEVVRLGLSRRLRGIIALSLVSLATALVLRGLWGGPWLMDVKGLGRIEAGNDLGLFTLAMIFGPMLIGLIDRKFGRRRAVLAAVHVFAAIALVLMAGGAPGLFVSGLFGITMMPPLYDVILLVLIGFAISAQPLLYGMARQLVEPQNAGKALAAVNLAFFLGAALMQSATGVVATAFGLPAVLLFMAAMLMAGLVLFLVFT
jgi:predicted MFS family arabinose efflux permease